MQGSLNGGDLSPYRARRVGADNGILVRALSIYHS